MACDKCQHCQEEKRKEEAKRFIQPSHLSPLPWRQGSNNEEPSGAYKIYAHDNSLVCDGQAKADVPYIITACDMFPRLVGALVKFRDMFVAELGYPFSGGDHEFVSELNALIEEAKAR